MFFVLNFKANAHVGSAFKQLTMAIEKKEEQTCNSTKWGANPKLFAVLAV